MTFALPAFVCDTCGRRFGVASNLNRHVRRCILRPVNASSSPPAVDTASDTFTADSSDIAGSSPPDSPRNSRIGASIEPPANGVTTESVNPETAPASPRKGKRARASSLSSTSHGESTSASPEMQLPSTRRPRAAPKRRRRAPSPSQWIPHSLLAFDLCPVEGNKATPVPLPPVEPVRYFEFVEERNSWNEHVGSRPYHPDEWDGCLPGPGPGGVNGVGREVGNFGGFVMGRLMIS
jgi:hypothetical protein